MLKFDAIAAAVILVIRLHIIYANRFINCGNVFERSNAYINDYAWYECDNFGRERLRYCIICNSPYSPMRGSYISRDALTAFGSWRGRSEYQLGDFCNELQLYGCQNIQDHIDGEFDVHEGGFCGNVYGSMRRRVRGRMFSC